MLLHFFNISMVASGYHLNDYQFPSLNPLNELV